ncbi:hypothetical protein TIFTF001_018605 [Ficus carica]|uniref:Uncharacterized protein n=1 Tax=Ficus carica TaxID=3494 RepID=A0AA88DBU2_FICCA|nr:hypothetical protein TIFTF001_018605 [Ficus carica]
MAGGNAKPTSMKYREFLDYNAPRNLRHLSSNLRRRAWQLLASGMADRRPRLFRQMASLLAVLMATRMVVLEMV